MKLTSFACDVKLPNGTIFGDGVDISTIAKAAERQSGAIFANPPASPPEIKDYPDFREECLTSLRQADVTGALLVRYLEVRNFDQVLIHLLRETPATFQMDFASRLLANCGMVAVNMSWLQYDPDGTEAAHIVALREYARSQGYVIVLATDAADFDRLEAAATYRRENFDK